MARIPVPVQPLETEPKGSALAPIALVTGALGLGALCVVGAYKLWVKPPVPRQLDVMAVVLDPSATVPALERCESLRTVSTRHLEQAEQDATIAVYAMGEAKTGNLEHLGTLHKRAEAVVYEHQDHDSEGTETGVLDELQRLCVELEQTQESPVHEAVEETLYMLANDPWASTRTTCDANWSMSATAWRTGTQRSPGQCAARRGPRTRSGSLRPSGSL